MTVAFRLAEFLVRSRDDSQLPPQTLDHAAMLIASTFASAACGIEALESLHASFVSLRRNEEGGLMPRSGLRDASYR